MDSAAYLKLPTASTPSCHRTMYLVSDGTKVGLSNFLYVMKNPRFKNLNEERKADVVIISGLRKQLHKDVVTEIEGNTDVEAIQKFVQNAQEVIDQKKSAYLTKYGQNIINERGRVIELPGIPLWSRKAETDTVFKRVSQTPGSLIFCSHEQRPRNDQASIINYARRIANLTVSIEKLQQKFDEPINSMQTDTENESGNKTLSKNDIQQMILETKASKFIMEGLFEKLKDVTRTPETLNKLKIIEGAKVLHITMPRNKITNDYISKVTSKRAKNEKKKKTATKKVAPATDIEGELKKHGMHTVVKLVGKPKQGKKKQNNNKGKQRGGGKKNNNRRNNKKK